MMGKTKNKNLAQVFHYELYGKREEKYDFLNDNSINSIDCKELDYKEPYFFFVPKDFELEDKYNSGFKVNELLINNNTGIQTKCDALSIHFENETLLEVVKNFQSKDVDELKSIYPFKNDSSGWNFKNAKLDLVENEIFYSKILYRPFDIRYTLYTGKSSGFIGRPRTSTMQHLIKGHNFGLITLRINGENDEFVSLITNHIIEKGSLPRGNYSIFPLYLYPVQETNGIFTEKDRKPNLNTEIVNRIAKKIGLEFVPEKINNSSLTINNYFAPIDILDYIYAVLHSPTYREKYKEFLKIDFPRVPYPKNKDIFWQLVKLGGEIRQIHLLESPKVEEYITSYPMDGDNTITTKISKKDWEITGIVQTHGRASHQVGRIWINEKQYFDKIPQVAWEFYIGGYQPAQKWLKDRRGRTLSFEDILHYQKIIVALTETDRLMKEIDLIEIENA